MYIVLVDEILCGRYLPILKIRSDTFFFVVQASPTCHRHQLFVGRDKCMKHTANHHNIYEKRNHVVCNNIVCYVR